MQGDVHDPGPEHAAPVPSPLPQTAKPEPPRVSSVVQVYLVRDGRLVLVVGVAAGSPAAATGLCPGDVITALAGHPVASVEDLAAALRDTEPDQQVPVTVVARGTGQVTPTVTIGSVTG